MPPEYIYYIGNWHFTYKDNIEAIEKNVNDMSKAGWRLITISSGLAYWRKVNPDYLKYLAIENVLKELE